MSFQDRTYSMARPGSEATESLGVAFSLFAGVLLILGGAFEAFVGLGAIVEERFYNVPANYAYHLDVVVWGWIHFVGGIIAVIAGIYVFSGQLWARIVGIAIAALSATANFFYIPYHNFWPILIIAIDFFVIWALAFYGGEDVS